ncbi:MAG TPA: hypothetical protein VG939_15905 [Caulobacteraceae bacterium]|nr:hypothetical protein [Caulobacteraceae bacterium]
MKRLRLRYESQIPLSIKIGVALFLAFQFPPVRDVRTILTGTPLPLLAAWVAVAVWTVVATLRLSRWPALLAAPAAIAWFVWWGVSAAPALLARPELSALGVGGLMLALFTLPHWRKMNWRFLGRLRTTKDVAEEFA